MTLLKLNLMVVVFLSVLSPYAKAISTVPTVDIPEEASSPTTTPIKSKNTDLETLSSSPLAPLPAQEVAEREEHATYFYPYEESFTLRLGLNHDLGDPPDAEDEHSSGQFGFLYMFESKGKTHIETGFDLFPKREEFLIHVGMKVVSFYTESFRPNYKLGGAIKLDSGDKFNTPLKTENYFVFAGLGFEDTLTDPLSFRVDLELFYSIDNILLMINTGLSLGF